MQYDEQRRTLERFVAERGDRLLHTFTVIGPAQLHGQQAIELKINVPPNNEAPPHVTAERMWVNAKSYLPMQGYTRWSNGQQAVFDYVFLPPTPERLAKLRPVIPAGYTRAGCAQGHRPGTAHGAPPVSELANAQWPDRSGGPATMPKRPGGHTRTVG